MSSNYRLNELHTTRMVTVFTKEYCLLCVMCGDTIDQWILSTGIHYSLVNIILWVVGRGGGGDSTQYPNSLLRPFTTELFGSSHLSYCSSIGDECILNEVVQEMVQSQTRNHRLDKEWEEGLSVLAASHCIIAWTQLSIRSVSIMVLRLPIQYMTCTF